MSHRARHKKLFEMMMIIVAAPLLVAQTTSAGRIDVPQSATMILSNANASSQLSQFSVPSLSRTHANILWGGTGQALGAVLSNTVSFLPAVSYDSGGDYGRSVAIADVNGDGKPDVIVANICAKSTNDLCSHGFVDGDVGVLLGNGNGTFQPAVNYGSGGLYSLSVAIADVNGDGKPDIVVSNRYGCRTFCNYGTVGVLLGNGDGTFQKVLLFESGGYDAWSVAVADVNGDGKPDLLVANLNDDLPSGTVGILLGNGDGTFQTAVSYDSGAAWALSVAVADVNGDGKPDVVLSNYYGGINGDGSVGILLGNADGSFGVARIYDSGGPEAISVAVADVNGDGKCDVLVANYYPGGSIGVLLGKGDGTFQPVATYGSGGTNVISVAVADVNGDGKPDVVAANIVDSPSVLLGNGNGTFQPAINFNSGGSPNAIAIADVNADGRLDVIVANSEGATATEGSVGVLLNNTKLTKLDTSTAVTTSLNPSIYGQKVAWTATVISSGSITPTGKIKFMWSIYTIGWATLNSSGVATLTKSNLNADTYPLTAVYVGDAVDLGSTSAVLNQVVVQATSSATLTSSPNPSTQGQAVTFTATISSPTVIPMGPVTFTAGKTVLGTAQLSGGKAKFTISTLAVGSTKVTATYYGNSNIAKSSASITQTVR